MPRDLGFATIAQRISALSSVGQGLRSGGPQPPAPGVFASTLNAQVAEVAGLARAADVAAQGAADPLGTVAGATGVAHRPPELGAGLRLTGQPSLILPQAPGMPTAVPGIGTGAIAGVAGGTVPTADGVHGGPGHVHGPPALDRNGPPAELQRYGNGRIPPEALETIGVGNHALWSPAARAFRDMMAAAAAEGITIGVNDSYRSYERQVEMVERYGLYSQGGRAASPGSSNHGWGVSIDLALDGRAQAWMREHARDYGFVEDVPREPWHWTFKASDY